MESKKRNIVLMFALVTLAAFLLTGVAHSAAIDDFIRWTGVRTEAELNQSLTTEYLGSETGITFLWKFDNPLNPGLDSSPNAKNGAALGMARCIATDTPFKTVAQGGMAAAGFEGPPDAIRINPGLANWSTQGDYTIEFWVKNPFPGKMDGVPTVKAVLLSGTSTEAGGGDGDNLRLWINPDDGSLEVGLRGYYTGLKNFKSAPLVWEKDKWYHIAWTHDYLVCTDTDVYRSTDRFYVTPQDASSVVEVISAECPNGWSQPVGGGPQWITLGGHAGGYYGTQFPVGFPGAESQVGTTPYDLIHEASLDGWGTWYSASYNPENLRNNSMTGSNTGNFLFHGTPLWMGNPDWGNYADWYWDTPKALDQMDFYVKSEGNYWGNPTAVAFWYLSPGSDTWVIYDGGWHAADWQPTDRFGNDEIDRVTSIDCEGIVVTAVRTFYGRPGGWPELNEIEIMGTDWLQGATTIATIKDAKTAEDGATVIIKGADVTLSHNDCVYIESPDRSHGIRVEGDDNTAVVGEKADIYGEISTNADGERCIIAMGAVGSTGAETVPAILPLGMNNQSLGGGDYNYVDSPKSGQKGVEGGTGLNNIGLLVKAWGKLTPATTTSATLDDGSGVTVIVQAPAGELFPIIDGTPYALVTGASSVKMVNGEMQRKIILRSIADLQIMGSDGASGRIWYDGTTDSYGSAPGKLLSDNGLCMNQNGVGFFKGTYGAAYYGDQILTGVTYSYVEETLNNPNDVLRNGDSGEFGNRLLDGAISGNWYVPAGNNYNGITPIFDFKKSYSFSEVDIFTYGGDYTKQIDIVISVADNATGPWTEVYNIPSAKSANGTFHRCQLPDLPEGRYMKVFCKSPGAITMLTEIFVWGDGTQDPTKINAIYTLPSGSDLYSIPGIDTTGMSNSQFDTWKSGIGGFGSQNAVWASAPTWDVISSAPILPAAGDIKNGGSIALEVAKNMTETQALSLTNTVRNATRTVTVELSGFKKSGVPVDTVTGEIRVAGAAPTRGGTMLLPLFTADNMPGESFLKRHVANGEYIAGFPSVKLTPGGSAVIWLSVKSENADPGVYEATLTATGCNPVTVNVTVSNVTLPDPMVWLNTWSGTTSQIPFNFSDRTEREVSYKRGLGVTVWHGFPTSGSAVELARQQGGVMCRVMGLPTVAKPGGEGSVWLGDAGYSNTWYDGDGNPKTFEVMDIDITMQTNIANHILQLEAQALQLGLTYDEWYVELWDEPGIQNMDIFWAFCTVIKDTSPQVKIYIDTYTTAGDAALYNAYNTPAGWYNSLIDISVPNTEFLNYSQCAVFWDYAPRFVNAFYRPANLKSEASNSIQYLRSQAWYSFNRNWNGWGTWSYYSPYNSAWNDMDIWYASSGTTGTNSGDSVMVYPGPKGPVATRISEGIRAGWEDYCLLTELRAQGKTADLNKILGYYTAGTKTYQELRIYALQALRGVPVP